MWGQRQSRHLVRLTLLALPRCNTRVSPHRMLRLPETGSPSLRSPSVFTPLQLRLPYSHRVELLLNGVDSFIQRIFRFRSLAGGWLIGLTACPVTRGRPRLC